MKPVFTRYNKDRGRRKTALAPTREQHEPVGCEPANTMPFDEILEDIREIDDLGDTDSYHTGRDGRVVCGVNQAD